MKLDEVKKTLADNGIKIVEEKRLGNDTGWQLRASTGQSVNVFDKGTVHVQGKDPGRIQRMFEDTSDASGLADGSTKSRNVFVVYGHDESAKTQLEAMLRRWDLNPLFLDQLPSEGQTIIEKLEKHQSTAAFAVVLATPDDEGHRADHSDERAYRARQNVVLELGMILALLGRQNVAILLKAQDKMERPSDIQGLIYIPFKDDITEAALPLAKEMNAQGLTIDLGKL